MLLLFKIVPYIYIVFNVYVQAQLAPAGLSLLTGIGTQGGAMGRVQRAESSHLSLLSGIGMHITQDGAMGRVQRGRISVY